MGPSASSVHHPYLGTLRAYLGERHAPNTIKGFVGHADRFLRAVGTKPAYSRQDVLGYVDALKRRGLKETSIHAQIAGIRAMFEANQIPWPLERRDAHLGMPQVDPEAPALAPEEVVAMIAAVKDQPGVTRTVVALASVYGLRKDEIARTLAKGCDGKRLEVQTAKGGRVRSHLIPPVLARALDFGPYRGKDAWTVRQLDGMFKRLLTRAAREPQPREGWHSLRRSVVTSLLEAGVNETDLKKWMGWRRQVSIVERYYKPDTQALDNRIYLASPFLRAWL